MKSAFCSAVALSVALVGLTGVARAAGEVDAKYFTISQINIEEEAPNSLEGPVIIIVTEPKEPTDPSSKPSGIPGVDMAHIVLSKIINMGKQIWDVVAANKPVVNIKTDTASALPLGVNSWENLSTWKEPKVRDYRVTYKNLYGFNVVDFKFRVLYTPGGSVEGKGAYLANATILPAHLTVAWGFTFNAQSTVANIMNAGTSKEPVAAMQMGLHWSLDTVLKHEENTENFYIKGDGSFKVLGSNGQIL